MALVVQDPQGAEACVGPPPPPFCGKTLVWSHAGPPVLLLPGGGTFEVRGLLFFGLVDFPAGAGICPLGPYQATVALTVTCSPAGDGGGMVTVPVVTGWNEVAIDVTLPAGPPRVCTVTGVAAMVLGDGMTLEASSDSLLCLAEPAPGAPGLPRLDLQPLGAPGSELVRVHPGDQAAYRYRVTNNDPSETFTGTFAVEMANTARLPIAGGPMPTGTGPYSVSDPVQGDNFPVGFAEDLFLGCVVLPPDPTDPQAATAERDLELAPGESIDVPIFARPWGSCANGSCGRATLLVDGAFDGVEPGIACSGFVTGADTSVPPSYLWPDSGEAADPTPMGPSTATLGGQPDGMGPPVEVDVTPDQADLEVDGMPVMAPPIPFVDVVEPERARIQLQFPGDFAIDSFFDVRYDIDVLPSSGQPIQVEMLDLQLLPQAPTGFETVAPVGIGQVQIRDGVGDVVGHLELIAQLHAVGIDDTGVRRDLLLDLIEMTRRVDGTGFSGRLGGTVAPGPGTGLDALEIAIDLRGFFSQQPQGVVIFADGFESGDVSRWSLSMP